MFAPLQVDGDIGVHSPPRALVWNRLARSTSVNRNVKTSRPMSIVPGFEASLDGSPSGTVPLMLTSLGEAVNVFRLRVIRHIRQPPCAERGTGPTKGRLMSVTEITRFDGVRVPAAEYLPVWINNLADDVTLEGSAMNGVVQGTEAVRSIVTYIRTLYDSQDFNFAGPYGANGFIEDYTAHVRGEPLGNVVLVTRNDAGQVQHIVANYRPRTTLLLVSRLVGEHFADTPYGEHFASSSLE
jgi:hypothetical protein